ncbi:mitochondrial import protein Pam17, partial [Tirmania nivea]
PIKPSQLLFRRHASSTTTTAASSTATATPITNSTVSTQPELISWEQFFNLRRTRRQYHRVCSIISALLATGAGAGYLGNIEVDTMPALFGLDMLTLFGLAIVGCGALGWLMGPAVGGILFKVMNRKAVKGMVEREKQFFQHIKKNRVDPSNHSFSNPVPDYYGEKVGSLKEYRQWLRDQRIYNRKRETFL